MRLSANLVVNYATVNQFSYANQWKIRAGDPNTLYFQLVDLDQNINNTNGSNGQNSNGPTSSLRYLAGIGSSNQPYGVQVTFPSIDDSIALTVQAVQVSPSDSSLWSVSLGQTQIVNSGNVVFAVTEGTFTRTFFVMNALSVEFPSTNGSC
jgi:hypothetical protein